MKPSTTQRAATQSFISSSRPGINIADNESLAIEAGKYANTIFHPVSTCKMGNDENAVVNNRLIAYGLQNLRIVDASVMPHITSGNTNAPTIMIAEKASDIILGKKEEDPINLDFFEAA